MKTKAQIKCIVTVQLISAFGFHYTDSTIPLLPRFKISSLQPSSVVVQTGLCRIWSETPETGFSRQGSFYSTNSNISCIYKLYIYDITNGFVPTTRRTVYNMLTAQVGNVALMNL